MASDGAESKPAAAPKDAASKGKKRGPPTTGGGDAKRSRAHFGVGDKGVFFTTVSPGATQAAKKDLIRLLEATTEEKSEKDPGSVAGATAASKLDDELKELKQKKPTFVACIEVAKGTGFIKFTDEAKDILPSEIVAKMLETQRAEYQATRYALSSRLLCRVLPIDHTCKPYIDDFKKLAEAVLPKHVGPEAEPTVWALEFKARNTNTLKKEAVLATIDEIVPKGRHKVSLNDPVKCILVEVNSMFCGLSVLTQWASLKKYNLHALTTPEEPKKIAQSASANLISESKEDANNSKTLEDVDKEDANNSKTLEDVDKVTITEVVPETASNSDQNANTSTSA